MSEQPVPNGHVGPTANEIAGLVSAERTAGEYVPVPKVSASGPEPTGKISGTEAVAAAERRAAATAGRNIEDIPPLPIPADTANARSGPPLNSACTAMLPLIGVWRGTGLFGNDPGAKDPQFGQQITISHDGRPFLRYESVCWLLAPDGSVAGPGPRRGDGAVRRRRRARRRYGVGGAGRGDGRGEPPAE